MKFSPQSEGGNQFQQWMATYGQGGNNIGAPLGDQANKFNQFMTGQAVLPFISNLPNYQQNLAQQSGNTTSMLKGEIPQDVVNQLATQSAERGIGAGVQGSRNSSAALLRALGLTSLDMQQRGSQQFSQQQQDLPTPELFNPASLWSPMMLANQELTQTKAGQAAQKAEADSRAASDAWNKGGVWVNGVFRREGETWNTPATSGFRW